jgi:hypothetical protein
MGEMDTQNKDEDVINAVLFGDDIKYVGGWNVWNYENFHSEQNLNLFGEPVKENIIKVKRSDLK